MTSLRYSLLAMALVAACGKGEAYAPPELGLPPVEPAAALAPGEPWVAPPANLEEVAVTAADTLTVLKVAALPEGPYDTGWKAAPYLRVTVRPQQEKTPVLHQATIDAVRVQMASDGQRVAWRLSWADASPDGNVDTGRFSDAVAVALPLDPGAAPQMGHLGARVQILYWKALWQKDADVHFQDVQDLHPNYWSDLYWFAKGEFPYPVPEAFADPASHQWFIAKSAGNPVAAFSREQPVEELVAEGPGSLTHQPVSAASGKGVWANGRWAVVLSRPLRTDDPLDAPLEAGKPTQLTLAVWDGSGGNVGGRKHWATNWLTVTP